MMGEQRTPSTGAKVEVTYSTKDIVALNVLIWPFWLGMISTVAALIILVPIFVSLVDGYSLGDSIAGIDWSFTGWVFVGLILWILFLVAGVYWLRRRKGLHGPILFDLTQEGVRFRNRQMEGVVFWTAIKSIKTRSGRLYLFVTRRSALIVPRRAFETDAEFASFGAAVREHWEGHPPRSAGQ